MDSVNWDGKDWITPDLHPVNFPSLKCIDITFLFPRAGAQCESACCFNTEQETEREKENVSSQIMNEEDTRKGL